MMPEAETYTLAETRNRLAWQCRRGMRELDELLQRYLERCCDTLGKEDLTIFARLLEYPDSLLLEFLMGRMVPADTEVARIVRDIRHATAP